MIKVSAGILAYRLHPGRLQVLLVHPGGPFFVNKDTGVWSVPKGEPGENEELLDVAKREFAEELGSPVAGEFIPLTPVKQKGGKVVHAWAVEAVVDVAGFKSNTFPLEWPPRSGHVRQFPEVDKAEWFTTAVAREKINAAQIAFIDELETKLNIRP